jgi:hypothetical protein
MEDLRRFNVCVIITVILKVLQLFVATTSEDPINRFTNPNPLLSHCDTWKYCLLKCALCSAKQLLETRSLILPSIRTPSTLKSTAYASEEAKSRLLNKAAVASYLKTIDILVVLFNISDWLYFTLNQSNLPLMYNVTHYCQIHVTDR